MYINVNMYRRTQRQIRLLQTLEQLQRICNVYMYIYVYVYTYVYMYIYVCICIYLYKFVYI